MKRIKLLGKRMLSVTLSVCMAFSMMPAMTGRAAESGDAIYAAAYRNAADVSETSLPAQAEFGGVQKEVTWDLSALSSAAVYDRVSVTGTTADGDRATAKVEVLPEENEVVYFVDASRDAGQESKAFDAVSALAGTSLKNAVADQTYDEASGWGRSGGNFKVKTLGNTTDATDKTWTGWYGNKASDPLIYQYRLEPGVYTVTAGFREWWSGPRTVQIKISGANTQSAASGNIVVSKDAAYAKGSVDFTVTEADLVKMELVRASGSEAPVISWFAVEKQSERKLAREALEKKAAEFAGIDGADYLEDSWNAFVEAREAAELVLENADASKEELQTAAEALQNAYDALEKLEGTESGVIVYAAAYQNAAELAGTSLPARVAIEETEKEVTWNIKSSSFANLYETANVSGMTADGEMVRAKVEVVPEAEKELVYFVDASRDAGQESKAFDAVSAFAGAALKNTVADQVYDEASGWGRSGENFKLKDPGNVDVTDKRQTGWYSGEKTAPLQYQYRLEAGVYTVTAGFREWWNANARNVQLAVSGEQTAEVLSERADLTKQGEYAQRSVTFEVKADSVVSMESRNASGGEAAVISWFAVEKEPALTAKAELAADIEKLPAVDAEKYTAESYQRFADALAEAQRVLADETADRQTVEAAAAELQAAYRGLMEPAGQKADKTALQAAVSQYQDTDVSAYTKESAKAFTDALAQAQRVLDDEDASQLAADEATAALQRAFTGLTIPEIKDSGVTVYAAAYQNAADVTDTSLPQKVTVKGQEVNVEWTIKSKKFAVPYQTVTVEGITENYYRVQAQTEVIPGKANPLVYFIDAARDAGSESQAFHGIKALRGDGLNNTVADQTYDETAGWGRTEGSFHARGTANVDVTDKYLTGWYAENGEVNSLNYQYSLKAGTYTVTAGFCEWWNGPRTMKMSVSGTETDGAETAEFAVSSGNSRAAKSLTFTVKADSIVTLSVENKSGSDAPVISWFGVAEGVVEVPNMVSETEIVINGSDVETAARNKNGLTYKGYGLLSGNSTSDLLMDYKTENPAAYEEMLQVLFGGEHPLINHVKMEMGNDGNNSTGADSCTMRFADEEADASRSPGFQLAADAKKINPDVKVSFLRWEMPAWVQSAWESDKTGAGYEAMYKWYRETIFDAYEKYGYVVDYVDPDKNETRTPDTGFIKWFRARVSNETEFPAYMDAAAREAYHKIKIIASDENTTLNIVPNMREDQELYDAIDAVGFHYSTGTTSSTADYRRMADTDDKEVWYSEGCGTFSYSEYQENKNSAYGGGTIGGYQSPLALADNVIASFMYSRKTHYIFQPAVGSFYEGAQYDHKEILSAREPWAGYVHYDPVIYMLQHFTRFAKTGWENPENTKGIWRVIAAASGNTSGNRGDLGHIVNENGNPSYMTLAAPDKSAFSVVIVNNSDKTVPYTISADGMNVAEGAALEIWETKTDSYMQYKGEAVYEDGCYIVEAAPFSMLTVTSLDCDGGEEYNERLPEEREKTVLDTDASGKTHNTEDAVLYADDFEYSGYAEDYLEKRGNEPRYAVDFSGAFAVEDGKLKQLLSQSVGQWNNYEPSTVIGDFRWMNYKASVDATPSANGYAGLNIRQQTGMGFEGSGYNLRITRNGAWTLKKRGTTLGSGTAAVKADGTYHLALEGKGGFITAWVDGVQVASYNDPEPEYFGRVRLGCGWTETVFDNLKVETVQGYEPYADKLIDNAADEVAYTGTWDIIAGARGNNNDWYRSTSTTSQANAAFSFRMNGGGFALIGENNGGAELDITVDGEKIAEDAKTQSSSKHCAAYMQYGLEDGAHDVTVTVKKGTFVLDAILSMPYMAGDKIQSTETVYAAAYAGGVPELPEKVTCTTVKGEQMEKEVTWNTENLTLVPYETVLVSGVTKDGAVPVSAQVEVVPEGLVYFVSGGTGTGYLDNKTTAAVSRPYETVAALVKELKNDSSDAAYTKESGWGYKDDDSMSSTIDEGDRPETYVSTDKYLVGLRDKTKGDKPMTYSFTLEAGNYVLTAGYHEFWGSRERDMQPKVVWTDAEGKKQTVNGSKIALRGENLTDDIRFALEETTVVEYQLSYVSGEAPMFSWLAVQKVEDTEEEIQTAKDALQQAIDQVPALDASKYTEESWQAYAEALQKAQALMQDEGAVKVQLETAKQKLERAYQNLKEIPKPDKSGLEEALEQYQTINAAEYTADSYQVFAQALAHAQEVQADADATKEQIEAALVELGKAYAGLQAVSKTDPVNPDPVKPDPEKKTALAAPAVQQVKSMAKKTGSVVKITVAKTENADTYAVYRNVKGKVTLIGETTSGIIEDVKPVSGKQASYYAIAKSSNAKFTDSAAGTAKTIKLAKDTKRVKVKKSGKAVKVTFRKVKKAKGYLVYRSLKKNGGWKKLTKKPVKKLSYTDKKVKKGKTYYYKVVVLGKNKTYSAGKTSKKFKNK